MRMFGVLDLETAFDGCRLHADFLIMPTVDDQPASYPRMARNLLL
jgi:hypothetical protein